MGNSNSFFKTYLKLGLSILSFTLMLSCAKNGDINYSGDPQGTVQSDGTSTYAVVATGIFGSGGAHSIVSYNAPRSVLNDLLPTSDDIKISSYGKYFYRIEGSNSHSITKFSLEAPAQPIWQFSTEGTENNSYPYEVVSLNNNKAYVIRYGSPKVWIINPSTNTESEFKIGELDLSSYENCGDGSPDPSSAVIVGKKLFIAMQRLCWWSPSEDSYIAVFDTETDQEINTGQGESGLFGIKLDVRNPSKEIKYYNGYIYTAGTIYPDDLWGTPWTNYKNYSGIQKINTNTYEPDSNIIYKATNTITSIEIISDTKGYFVQYNAWGNNSLRSFNPQTGVVDNTNIAGIGSSSDRNINDIIRDKHNRLWISDSSLIDPGVYIVDTTTDTIEDGPIYTNLNPLEIVFCEL